MKNFKRFTAMIAALTLSACAVAPMAMSASAASTENTISFTDEVASTGHTYIAYKIFGGTVEAKEDGTKELTGIVWANAEGSSAFLAALKNDTTIGAQFTSCSNAAEVAKVLSRFNNDSAEAKAFAKVVVANKDNVKQVNETASATITASDDGYYVIVESPLNNTPEDSAMTSYLLSVYDASEGAELSVKSDIPKVIKKIKENSALDNNVGTTDNNMSDYTIPDQYNDTADFSIGDTVPFQIVGSMPSNIGEYKTYKYIFHDTLDSQFTLAENFATNGVTVKINDTIINSDKYSVAVSGNGITITFNDIKSAGVDLTAASKVVVDYSATLSNAAVIGQSGQKNAVYLEYSNNPNVDGDGETDTTSKTPTDEVIAFTYELDVTKIDGANADLKLPGAKFNLQATSGEHDGKWVIIDTDGKVSGWVDNEPVEGVLTSGNDGIFKVIGLDDGTYSLKETEAPDGYNILTDAVEFTIAANTSNNQNDDTINGEELVTLTIQKGTQEAVPGDLAEGIVGLTVENNSGSTLPSTGGMGTTLFYIGGGAMVAVAGIFLITKKRMNKDAE